MKLTNDSMRGDREFKINIRNVTTNVSRYAEKKINLFGISKNNF